MDNQNKDVKAHLYNKLNEVNINEMNNEEIADYLLNEFDISLKEEILIQDFDLGYLIEDIVSYIYSYNNKQEVAPESEIMNKKKNIYNKLGSQLKNNTNEIVLDLENFNLNQNTKKRNYIEMTKILFNIRLSLYFEILTYLKDKVDVVFVNYDTEKINDYGLALTFNFLSKEFAKQENIKFTTDLNKENVLER